MRRLIWLALPLFLLSACGPEPGPVMHPGLEKELARGEYELATDYYGAYIERFYEFPGLRDRIPPEELALIGYSYGQCLAELAFAEPLENRVSKSKAARLLEMAGDSFLIAAEQNLPEYIQPAVYSAVRVYKQALDLEGGERSDLAESALAACEVYFNEREERPGVFILSEDDADIALVNVELLYRSGEETLAEAFLDRFLSVEYRELDEDSRRVRQASLLGRLGDQTFDAGLYKKSGEIYLRAYRMVDPEKEEELAERWSSNAKVAEYHQAFALEAEVPQVPAVFLDTGEREQLNRALKWYAEVIRDYPGHEVAVSALYRRGLIFQHWLNDPLAAEEAYARLAVDYPGHALAPAAVFRAGLMAEMEGSWSRAREYYEELERGDSPEADLVLLREALHENDVGGLNRFITRHSDDPAYYIWVGEAYAALGLLAEQEGAQDRAAELYTRAVEEHSRKAVNRYGSPAIAHAYHAYAKHYYDAYMEIVVRGTLEEVNELLVQKTRTMDRATFGFNGAATFGSPELVAEAQYMAAQVFEEYATMLQDVVITGGRGATADEIEEAYFAINARTYFYLVAAREAYKTAVKSASLDPEDPTYRLASEGYGRLVEITGEE